MKKALIVIIVIILALAFFGAWSLSALESSGAEKGEHLQTVEGGKKQRAIFGVFAEGKEQLHHALILAESIRTYAGSFKNSPIWIYVPEKWMENKGAFAKKLLEMDAEIKGSTAPEQALAFPYARKVFAAAKGEAGAKGKAEIFIWLDDDTVFLQEPGEFILDRGVSFGYRPVTHKLIGSLFSEPLDAFWERVYDRLSVPETAVFPMTTPADSKTIRPYFNAGLLLFDPNREFLESGQRIFPSFMKTLYLPHGVRKTASNSSSSTRSPWPERS